MDEEEEAVDVMSAGNEPAGVAHPGEKLFHLPPRSVTVRRTSILSSRSTSALAGPQHWLDCTHRLSLSLKRPSPAIRGASKHPQNHMKRCDRT